MVKKKEEKEKREEDNEEGEWGEWEGGEEKEETDTNKKVIDKKNKLKVLIFLVSLVLIMDAFGIYFYYYEESPNTIPNSIDVCTDGTPYELCSKEKPFYCYNGELLKKAFTCGCPKGFEIDFQSCKEI